MLFESFINKIGLKMQVPRARDYVDCAKSEWTYHNPGNV